jgi:hypothetical protein
MATDAYCTYAATHIAKIVSFKSFIDLGRLCTTANSCSRCVRCDLHQGDPVQVDGNAANRVRVIRRSRVPSAFYSKTTPMVDHNIENGSDLHCVRWFNTASRADFLLFSIPDRKIIVVRVM